MYLQHLSLTNFRNYARLEIDLPARIVVLQGRNAQGKTNFLESIYFLATSKSPLAASERQLIHWLADNEVIPYARVTGLYHKRDEEHTIEITLVKETRGQDDGEMTTLRRQVRLDDVPRRILDVLGQINVVLFLPEDLALVAGAPGERRRYLDVTLCQIDARYCRSLARYNRVLSQRNALLRQMREGHARPNELPYWDDQLSSAGAYVLARRYWVAEELGGRLRDIHPRLTGTQEELSISYASTLAEFLPEGTSQDEQDLQARFIATLHGARRAEVARGLTLIGPHRDDLHFAIRQHDGANIDATVYGSRGQQRTVALSLKLAEVNLMRAQTGELPILLLDDVLSELDPQRSAFLLDTVTHAQQVLITTTNLAYYPRSFLEQATVWQVTAGCLRTLPREQWEQ